MGFKLRKLQNPGQIAAVRRILSTGVSYMGGQWDLISRLIMRIIGVIIWVIGVISLLTKSA